MAGLAILRPRGTTSTPGARTRVEAGALGARLGPAVLSTLALLLAFVAQWYMNRRVYVGDAVYLFIWSTVIFALASPTLFQAKRTSPVVTALRVLLILAAVAVLVQSYLDFRSGQNYIRAVVLAVLPLMLVGTALAGSRVASRPDDEKDGCDDGLWQRVQASPTAGATGWGLLVGSALLFAVALGYWFRPGKSNEAILVNILSLVLLFAGLYWLDRGKAAPARGAADAPPLAVEVLFVLIIVGVGAFLRLWQIESLPFGVWYDEAETGLEAYRIFKGIPYTAIGTYSPNNPSLFFYVIAFVYRFLGPTLLSVRLVQALAGLAAVPGLYLFLRFTLGWRTAVVGAFLLAVSSWHVNFSRFGMPYSIGATAFEVLTLLFLMWGLRSGRVVAFAWAGLAAGLGLHTYTGFRIFPLALLVYLAYGFILGKDRIRQSVPNLIVFAAVTVVTFAPLGTWALQHRQEFLARTGQTSVFAGKNTPQERAAALTNSLRRHVMMINYHGDGNGRHNTPGAPAMDYVSAAAFVVGLGYCLYRWRSPIYLLLAAWFFVTMLAGVLSLDWEAPQMARTIVAVPAICAIAAVTLGRVWQAWDAVVASLAKSGARLALRTVVIVLVVALLASVGYVNYDRYFNRQMKNSESFYSFSTIETVVGRRVAELGPTANRYYLQNLGSRSFAFLAGGEFPDRPVDAVFFRPYEHMPLRQPATKTSVYLLEPWRVTIEPADVLRYYPNAEFIDHKDPFGKTMVYEFRVPPQDANALLGLTGAYYAGTEPTGTPVLTRRDRIIAFDWRSESPLPKPFNVEWTGTIVPSLAGDHTFEVESDGQVRMWLGDELIIDTTQGRKSATLDLPKGQQPVRIQFVGERIELLWTLPGGQRQTIPNTALIAVGLPSNGLVGRYYRGDAWQGRPEFVQVDPYLAFRWHPDPIEGGPWSVSWQGTIAITQTAQYMFQGVTNDRMWLTIDGQTVLNNIQGMGEKVINLTAGRHTIEVKYANRKGYSEMRLMWRLPDGTFGVVPNSVLFTK